MRFGSGFHQQGLWGGAGWFEVRFYQGFTRRSLLSGFRAVLRGLRGGFDRVPHVLQGLVVCLGGK